MSEQPGEHPSTYMVQDRSNQQELERVHLQDQMITTAMGGVLPEQEDSTALRRILDVGCGTGDWSIEVARTLPTLERVVGVDMSAHMLTFAREQAQQQGAERVEFASMDALRMLEFPNASFDLVNQRFGQSWIRTWDWPKLLSEYQRVCRPGGIIRITEGTFSLESFSPALNRLNELCMQAFFQAGHLFTPTGDGITSHLARVLTQYGLTQVQTHTWNLEFRAGTPAGQLCIEDIRQGYRTIMPFLRKWGSMPKDYEQLYHQALRELQEPGWASPWTLVTAWGRNPGPTSAHLRFA
ncbi:methyltransferase domain-containing protein [Ktedonosporobacter rubrisoli]|uniref:Methyltransferase domain-containing protein n=1 Tax=Ktedonosporobacter rubrisoli TaxID=2509675 RepID=A0A4P6JJ16_KTERU|nr:methyltransferase domain-containing protein [Ktedonosporobacter rubrisoli]QBD75094.1 methyltransferase domain-containing protein [Ktedonosporobacter rubrisoli]